MEQPIRFVGMEVHKDTIVVAVAATGEVGKVTAYGTFPNTGAGPALWRPLPRPAGHCSRYRPRRLQRLVVENRCGWTGLTTKPFA
jgi:hypothetical protein